MGDIGHEEGNYHQKVVVDGNNCLTTLGKGSEAKM